MDTIQGLNLIVINDLNLKTADVEYTPQLKQFVVICRLLD
jgi:hypothetical protein